MANKAALARTVRKATGLSYRQSAQCVDIIVDALADFLSAGEKIELRGLGSFYIHIAPEKLYPSLRIENKTIPAHGRISFRPCEKLRRSVWNCSHTN